MKFLLFFTLAYLSGLTSAHAEIVNPNLLPFGEEEAFLGNAGIAYSESTGASYYNPGALGFVRQKKISVYSNAYMTERAYVRSGYDIDRTQVPISSDTFSTVPLSSVSLFGNEKHTYAFSILSPHTNSFDFQIPFQDGTSNMNYVGSQASSSLWIGPSFARRDSDTFSFGVSLFALRNASSRTSILYINKPSTPNAIGAFGTRIRGVNWAALVILGAQWKFSPVWTFGARLQSATASVRGRTDIFGVAQGTVSGAARSELTNEQGLHSQYRLPWNFGAGVKYSASNALDLLFDLNVQAPIHYNTLPANPSSGINVNTRLRPRFNFGTKYRLNPTHNVLFGLLYNPSAMVMDSRQSGALDGEDFKGVTLGYQLDTGVLVTAIGGFYLWANGLYRTSDVFGNVTGSSSIDHQLYGALLTASYKL